jgi:glucose-6-phosphate 1-dehydrogenase
VRTQLGLHAADASEAAREQLAASVDYVHGDVTDPSTLRAALRLAADGEAVVLYLALPHVLFEDVVAALRACELPSQLRVVVEKPFGEDLAGAQRLNAALAAVVPEERTFRVDHFLAKQTVLNILGLRFANRIFESLWSNAHITGVDIVFDETVDAQARASYYDRSGALRDMVQNHLLQLLAYVAMEPPLSMDPLDLATRKIDVLRAVRTLGRDEVASATLRGRYGSGLVRSRNGERQVAAYIEADGVDPGHGTEPSRRSFCTSTTGVGAEFLSGCEPARRWRTTAGRW